MEDEIIEDSEDKLDVELENEIVEELADNDEAEGDQTEDEESEGGLTVTIGDEEPEAEEHEEAPKWVKELRKSSRADKKELKRLRALVSKEAEVKPVTLGEEPTLESCDYDTATFKAQLRKWDNDKLSVEKQNADKLEAEESQKKEYEGRLENYTQSKADLKVSDFEDVEEDVVETLSISQQNLILQGSDNSALLVYALGKNKKKLKTLSEIKDPVKFTFAVAKLEAQLKTTKGKPRTKPEKTLKSTGGTNSIVDSTLERLMAEADISGDRSKVAAYRRKIRNK